MTPTTPPAVSKAMREAVARIEYLEKEEAFLRSCLRSEPVDNADALVRIASLERDVARLTGEREEWKRVAERAGVCMTCALGAPDISIGCTDCLNTGFAHGAPQGYVSEGFHEEEVAKLKRQLENRQDTIDVLEEVIAKKERSCARKNDDGSWDLSGPCLTCGAADEHICGRGARGYTANPTALAEARAEGRRQGLKEAAKIADEKAVSWTAMDYDFRAKGARSVAQALRSLATPPETQKPEPKEDNASIKS